MQSPDFKHMLGRLLGPAKAEIGCDECFEQLDRYVDLQVAGHDADAAEQSELLAALQDGISALTPHQRRVLVALAVNGVPIDVLADRLNTNRGALYKTLHDARRNLRTYLTSRGFDPVVSFEESH